MEESRLPLYPGHPIHRGVFLLPCAFWLALVLLRSGDVELNPGPKAPPKEAKPDKAAIMATKVDEHDAKLEELEGLVKAQAEIIEELKKQQVELVAKLEEKQVELRNNLEANKVELESKLEEKQVELRNHLEANKVEAENSLGQLKVALEDDLRRRSSNLDDNISSLKAANEQTTKELKAEIKNLMGRVESGVDNLGSQSADTTGRVREMEIALEDVQEKIWELDKSWKNNLVFYGIKADAGVEEHPSITETKIREVIKHLLQISREVPIVKVRRTPNGPTVRGSKPITVCFERWGDKDEILRKANLLRGSNIYISEDFSKKVKDQRAELQKFLKLVRRKKPSVKYSLHFDKLFLDNEIYIYNEVTGQVEQVTATLNSTSPLPGERPPSEMYNPSGFFPLSVPVASMRQRKNSSGKTRLEKSYSTESSLNHMVPNAPVHPQRTKPAYDSETDPESLASSPVKSRHSKMNGTSNGSPRKGGLKDALEEEVDADEDDEAPEEADESDEYKSRKFEPDIPETIPE